MNESDKRLKKIDPALRKQGLPQGQLTKKLPSANTQISVDIRLFGNKLH